MIALRTIFIVSVGLIAGCGDRNSATSGWVNGSSTTGQTAPPPANTGRGTATTTTRVQSVTVRQESTQTGIAADVYRLDTKNQQQLFVSVDDSGRATPGKFCGPGDRFQATPKVDAYLRISPLPCSATLDFELPSVQTSYALIVRGDDANKNGDFSKAQAYYGLAAARFAVSQPYASLQLQDKARIAAGHALDVQTPTVRVDNEEKLTVEAQEKLKAFQLKTGLTETGKLDAATQWALSGISKDEALRSARAEPTAAVQAAMAEYQKPRS